MGQATGDAKPAYIAPITLAEDDKKIQDYNYQATREAIKRAVTGQPTAAEMLAKKGTAAHPFAAN